MAVRAARSPAGETANQPGRSRDIKAEARRSPWLVRVVGRCRTIRRTGLDQPGVEHDGQRADHRFARGIITEVPNRLASEKSPYLLQHKDNPVDWYPWGRDAFDRARQENKPIFLSIGYST